MCFRTDHLRALSCTVTLVCLTQPAYQIFVLGREGVNVSPDCGAEKVKGASESFHSPCGDSKLHVSPSFQSASSTENWGYLQELNKQSTQPSATTGFLNTPNTQVNSISLCEDPELTTSIPTQPLPHPLMSVCSKQLSCPLNLNTDPRINEGFEERQKENTTESPKQRNREGDFFDRIKKIKYLFLGWEQTSVPELLVQSSIAQK